VSRNAGIVLMLLLYVGSPDLAAACECFVQPTCATTWAADVVFVGTAARVSAPSAGVEDVEFTLHSEGIGFSCDYDFTQGVKYLVMAQRRGGVWTAVPCGGTRPFPGAISDVNEIRNAVRSRAPGTVSGTVVVDVFPDERVGGSVPIVGAAVTLRAGTYQSSVLTDAKGAYRLARVPSGTYELIVDVPSNATPVPAQRLVVGANACITRVIFSEPRW
jgi:Carboxypeptidase regulatory-like domain